MIRTELPWMMIRVWVAKTCFALGLTYAGFVPIRLAVAAPAPDTAAAPVRAPRIDAAQLAVVERALEFCGSVDTDSAKKLQEKVSEITKGASADSLAQARNSEAYKQAYSSMSTFIDEIDPRNAKVACTNTAVGK